MNFSNEMNSELPVNQISSYPNSSSNSNSFPNNVSSLGSRSISNRFYTLANLSPSSSAHISGDELSGQPHNRQNVLLASKPSRQIRNNYRNNFRNNFPSQFYYNTDIANDRPIQQEILDVNNSGSPRTNIDHHTEYHENNNINRVSNDLFNSYSLRSLRNNQDFFGSNGCQNNELTNISIKNEEDYKSTCFGKSTCPMLELDNMSPQTVVL